MPSFDIVKKISPRITVPMHYRDDEKGFGFDVLSTIEPFVKYFDNRIHYIFFVILPPGRFC